jgi:arylsulfatase A
MGTSAWEYSTGQPFQARPLPLFSCTVPGQPCTNASVVEQPTNLGTLTARYADAALEFVGRAKFAGAPFFLYIPFNHVHSPNFASVEFCNTSAHGSVGDATQELDHAVGLIQAGVAKFGLDDDTVYFFTSDNGSPVGNDRVGNGPLRDGKFTTWEGGVREPAFIRWKGGIAGGRVTAVIAATYDIFSTVLSIAGVAPPAGVHIDGQDLTAVLKSAAAPPPRRCILHYWSSQQINSPQNGETDGVSAVRCGSFKAHYYVKITGHGSNHTQTTLKPGVQDPPALFDLDSDLSESEPIDPNGAIYKTAMTEISAALAAHRATVEMVPNQMIGDSRGSCNQTAAPSCVGGNDISTAVCKDPASTSKYPSLPNCTSNPEFYGTEACRAAEKECIAKCMPGV